MSHLSPIYKKKLVWFNTIYYNCLNKRQRHISKCISAIYIFHCFMIIMKQWKFISTKIAKGWWCWSAKGEKAKLTRSGITSLSAMSCTSHCPHWSWWSSLSDGANLEMEVKNLLKFWSETVLAIKWFRQPSVKLTSRPLLVYFCYLNLKRSLSDVDHHHNKVSCQVQLCWVQLRLRIKLQETKFQNQDILNLTSWSPSPTDKFCNWILVWWGGAWKWKWEEGEVE